MKQKLSFPFLQQERFFLIPMGKMFCVLCLIILSPIALYAQYDNATYLQTKEKKKFNFGIGLGLGYHTLGIDKSNKYLNQNEFVNISPHATFGFFIDFITNYNFKKHWALRSSFPLFHYSNYNISYKKLNENQFIEESFVFDHFKVSLPIEVLFKSDIIKNFRFYFSAGAYSSYNFTSNLQLKNVSFLRINPYEQGALLGFGFMFGGEYTVTSVELKYQYGFTNIFTQEVGNMFSESIDKLKTRNLILAIHF